MCTDFVICMYICSKPVFFCDSRPVFITFFETWVPFWTPFWTICCNYFEPDLQALKIHIVGIPCACLAGLPRTHHRRGGNQKAPRSHRSLGGTRCQNQHVFSVKVVGRVISRARERRDHHRLQRLRTRFRGRGGAKSPRTNT